MTASVEVALDTRPPVLTVIAEDRVEPPDALEVTVIASEPLGPVGIAVEDSLGRLLTLGHTRTDPTTVVALVPTTGVGGGPATIRVHAADVVWNFTHATHQVYIDRPRAFDVEFTMAGSHDVALAVERAFDVEADVRSAFEVDLSLDRAHEHILDLESIYETTLEVY